MVNFFLLVASSCLWRMKVINFRFYSFIWYQIRGWDIRDFISQIWKLQNLLEIVTLVTFARIAEGQYYPGYFSRNYGPAPPSHYDYYRHKVLFGVIEILMQSWTHDDELLLRITSLYVYLHCQHVPYQDPSNYLLPYPKPPKPYYGKEYPFNGPHLPPFQIPIPDQSAESNTPNSTSTPPTRDNRCEYMYLIFDACTNWWFEFDYDYVF